MDLLDSIDHSLPAEPAVNASTQWSPRQEAIFDETRNGTNNLLVQAVAGSGKTTTLVKATELAEGSTLFLAFNKAIAEELKTKVRSGDVKTMNALGHRLWLDNSNAKFEMHKMGILIDKICPPLIAKDYGYTISRVVGLAKGTALGIQSDEPSTASMAQIIENYQFDIPCDQVFQIAEYCLTAFQLSVRDDTCFDFDDQLYGPLYHGWNYPVYSNVLVDEAQDLSPIQHAMLQAMRGSRIIAVGDRHQAIYGFRGASHDSMDELAEIFTMKELPLDITYRCPLDVVQEAQRLNPDIRARDGAPAGLVSSLEDSDSDPKLFVQGQLVLARTNAPLFRAILRHIREREPCRVLSNFLDSFNSFVRTLAKGPRGSTELRNANQVIDRLESWYIKEREAAQGRRGRLAYLHDRYETVKLLLEQHSTVYEACETVRRLAECRTGPIFSTIHKAKGLEASDVYIIRPDLMPHPMADDDKELVQEQNLKYVAITRSSNILTFGQREF